MKSINDLIPISIKKTDRNGKEETFSTVIKRLGVSDTLYVSKEGFIFLKTDEGRLRLTDNYCSGSAASEDLKNMTSLRMREINDVLSEMEKNDKPLYFYSVS